MIDAPLDAAHPNQDHAATGHDYVVVARRYRPQGFSELVGQDQVATALSNAITTNRIGHAYLFTGARGVGKTSTARIFAKALNCEQGPTPNPCNQCDSCLSVATGDDVDVIEIDGASNNGVDSIRELRSTIIHRPSRSRFKIYIIDEVHMVTTQAFNALLKTLEEPPEHAKFIFCTTDPDDLPITVLSRCQRFDFLPVEMDAIQERLRSILEAEGRAADDDALRMLARRAAGSMRDSQSLLEQMLSATTERITSDDIHRLIGTARTGRLIDLGKKMLARDTLGTLAAVQAALQEGVDPGQLGEQLAGYLRDAMAVAVGCDPKLLLTCDTSDYADLKELADRAGMEGLLAIFQIIDQCVERMRDSHYPRMLLEVALVRVCQLENLSQLSELIDQLRAGMPVQRAVVNVGSPAVRPSAPAASTPGASVQAVATSPARPVADQKKTADLTPPAGKDTVASGPSLTESNFTTAATTETTTTAATTTTSATDTTAATDTSVPVVSENHPVHPTPSSPTPSSSPVLEASRLWNQALDQLEDMTADYARAAQRVRWLDADRLIVTFSSERGLQKQSCERPDRRQKLEVSLQGIAGRPVRVEFELLAATAPPPGPRKPAAANRVQRMRELERNPFVSQAKAIFEAEIVDIAEPRVVEPRNAEVSGAESQT
ncbi:MAG: DNA polymerase III subunit gamma/tau [Planctomycetota bacterium]